VPYGFFTGDYREHSIDLEWCSNGKMASSTDVAACKVPNCAKVAIRIAGLQG